MTTALGTNACHGEALTVNGFRCYDARLSLLSSIRIAGAWPMVT